MENQQGKGIVFKKFTWVVQDFSKNKTKKQRSKAFEAGGCKWRILMFPKGNKVDYLSLYLDVADSINLPAGWSRHACFSLAVINQVSVKKTVKKETHHLFNSRDSDWGYTSFMPLSELYDPRRGYIIEDTCIIDAEISIPKSGKENQAAGPVSLESGDQTGQMEVESSLQDREREMKTPPLSACVSVEPAQHTGNPSLPAGLTSNPMDELVDFWGLGKIENVFVPLLEEVCSKHSSLIECQRKRSQRFVEWAFTSLGRVLHFLKTKRVKDMNDEACEHLQILGEELETFRFDLSWLEPHVQSALGMKNYLEKAMRVKKLRENVSALEMEMKRLKAKLAAAEIDLEIAKRDLVQAEEGFEEKDLDAELGYGRP
ncbi:MATH domain and coiled-coil domain-containing protein At3g58270-like isoform X5 [Prosopis cineraria]|uniref:MATH domain and coiled-coil domain-containing protein At3g58270-like isoform X5 n=1 Tax=Prosopis cineraria TaxID=364024 RepID=UPI002410318A|nr:MATH domain and coiled-coil domain-containing protein At3g58270-like isoform X5 [Prosopis cineraria]